MSSPHLDMYGKQLGTQPPAAVKEALIHSFSFLRQVILYRINPVSLSLPAFCILDFLLLLLFTMIYLLILINKWIPAGVGCA